MYGGLGGHFSNLSALVDSRIFNHDDLVVFLISSGDPNNEILEYLCKHNIRHKWFRSTNFINKIILIFNIFLFLSSRRGAAIVYTPIALIPVILVRLGSNKNIFPVVYRDSQVDHLKSLSDKVGRLLSFFCSDYHLYLTNEARWRNEKLVKFQFIKKKFRVIENGVDLTRFSYFEARRRTGRVRIGMISRIELVKNHVMILNAAERLQNSSAQSYGIEFVIAGAGQSAQSLASEISRRNLINVRFVGRISDTEIQEFLATLNVYIHSTFGESMSNSVMQAMSSGLPVLASDVPDMSAVITDGVTGILFSNDDCSALMDKILYLVNSELERLRIGRNARAYALKHFSNIRMAINYKELAENRA